MSQWNEKQKLEAFQTYASSPKICKKCGKELPYNRRKHIFCDNECYSIYFGKDIPITKCLFCEKQVRSIRNKFCSFECSVKYHWQHKIEVASQTGFAPPHQLLAKDLILKMRGRKCEICGITEWMEKQVPLVMDHINGNSDDWRLDNLRLVCGNCDMQLPTYKSKNIGSGGKRGIYRTRYKKEHDKKKHGELVERFMTLL